VDKNTVASVFESFFRSKGEYMLLTECSFILPMNPCSHHVIISRVKPGHSFPPWRFLLSLYRGFGATEVFNEVLGDYYIVICLCSRGSPFGLFDLQDRFCSPSNISPSLPMWQCLFWVKVLFSLDDPFLSLRGFRFLMRLWASLYIVFSGTSVFLELAFKFAACMWGSLVLVVTWPLSCLLAS